MIKFYHNKNKTIAVLCDTEMDCINKISKTMNGTGMCMFSDKYLMPKSFRATVICHAPDEFDAKVGEEEAKKKVMKKYYAHLDEKWNAYQMEVAKIAMNSGMNVMPRTEEIAMFE